MASDIRKSIYRYPNLECPLVDLPVNVFGVQSEVPLFPQKVINFWMFLFVSEASAQRDVFVYILIDDRL